MDKTNLRAPWRATLLICACTALAACEGTDFERGALGAGGGALAAEALGKDPVVGAVVGGTAGVVCDDVTPQLCQ